MRITIIIFFAFLSQTVFADGVDRIHVYLNGKIIFLTEVSNYKIDYTISTGDTLLFDAWTDWDLLDKATLTLKSLSWDEEIVLLQENNTTYGAQFFYIIKEADLKVDFKVILNYNIPNFEPTHFLSINKGTIE